MCKAIAEEDSWSEPKTGIIGELWEIRLDEDEQVAVFGRPAFDFHEEGNKVGPGFSGSETSYVGIRVLLEKVCRGKSGMSVEGGKEEVRTS